MPKKTSRPPYSQRFLEKYGRGLTPDEVRLVQGYRGLHKKQRAALLTMLSHVLIENTQAGVR